jgi:hypothetical protein
MAVFALHIFENLSLFSIRALDWFPIFLMHVKIRAIASMESTASRAR